MEYRNLGKSGLKVSEVGLGGNNFGGNPFGQVMDEQTSISVIHHALELGINYIDTSNNYGISEKIIGKAIKDKRSEVIISTKFSSVIGKGPNDVGASRYHLIKAVDLSLKNFNSDYIDLLLLHRPDPKTPIEETLRALDNLVKVGKVRYIGCCNFPAWKLCEALWTSKVNKLEAFSVVQDWYNMVHRDIESELLPCCKAYGIGLIPYRPLAEGFLTDEYQPGKQAPSTSRLANPSNTASKNITEANIERWQKLRDFASSHEHSISELAIAWLLSHPFVSSVIAGSTTKEQVSSNITAANWKLTNKDVDDLEKVMKN